MKYKAIFIDADNTLLNKDYEISPENKKSVLLAHEMGVHITICSGRSYLNLIHLVEELGIKSDDTYLSSFNGGIICKGSNFDIIRKEYLEKEVALSIIEQLRQFDVNVIAYNDPGYTVIERENKHTQRYYSVTKMPHKIIKSFAEELAPEIPKLIAFGYYEELEKVKNYLGNGLLDDRATMFSSANTLLEFTNKNATKGAAVEYLSGLMGIDLSETIAIGDNQNDISMMQTAGLGIAVANARDYVKAYADYVTTATNNEGAVAEVINKFILA